jgi:hypothetical protein
MVIIEDNGIGRKRSAQLKRLKEKNSIKVLLYQQIKSD